MFNKSQFDNSRSDGFAVLEVVQPSPDAPRAFVPLRRTELGGEVTGPLADLRLLQYFGYSAEQCDKTIEALYRFPMPGDAAVTGVTVRFGDVEIRAELKERERAEADYEEAKRQGRQAALATRESPDVFTLRVAGLQPDQEIRVETCYVQLARMEAGDWTLRIPLTTAPRYVRGDETGSRHAQGQPLALLRDPGHRYSMDLRFPDAGSVECGTHALSSVTEDNALRVRLADGEVLPDRDCVLKWRPVQETQHPALHLHLYDDRAEKAVYFLALIAPPSDSTARTSVARESVLLVDHSGSMEGPKWQAADWAVKQFLNGLNAEDSFALGLFHNTVRWFGDRPRRADASTVAAAVQFLETHRDSGGTELGVALEQALGQKRGGGEMSRHVLILTDAEVSDSGRILRLAESESAKKDRRRISVLCIDAAPNSFLARELAERGGGTATFLTSQPEEEDVTTALDRILEDWSAPVLTGLRLEMNRTGAEAVGRATLPASRNGGSAIDIGDLPAGRAVWVAGRVPRGDSPDLAFRLLTADGREIVARRCDLEAKSSGAALKSLFGASRVTALEFLTTGQYDEAQIAEQLKRMGYDPAELDKTTESPALYAENTRKNAREGLKRLLVREALRYGIACGETAFIAVRKEAGKVIEETSVVANALPSGWDTDMLLCAAPAMAMPMQASYAAAPPSPTMRMMRSAGPSMPKAKSAPLADMAQDLMSAIPVFLRNRAGGGPAQPGSAPTGSSAFTGAAAPPASTSAPVFAGIPVFQGREAVLIDTSRPEDDAGLAGAGTFTRLIVSLGAGAKDAASLDQGLSILIYVDDLASPRARVRLCDIVKRGGVRPLNLRRSAGQVVRIVIEDANGVWASGAPSLEVTLE